MLAGASARARTVREHDQACMSLHLRGRSRRELLSAPPCTAHMHDFSPACWMKFPSPRVISREFGREHRHMMHEWCCTYCEQHHGVVEAFLSGCFGTFFSEILCSGDNFCLVRVIFREFGRVSGHQYTMMLLTHGCTRSDCIQYSARCMTHLGTPKTSVACRRVRHSNRVLGRQGSSSSQSPSSSQSAVMSSAEASICFRPDVSSKKSG